MSLTDYEMLQNEIVANQVRINDLDEMRKGSMNCIKQQREEITELKTQIERYQKLVCQTCDGHGAVGNILDSMDCPDCLAYEKRIKADVIKSTINDIEIGLANAHLDGDDVLDYLNIALNKLKDQNKGE